MCTGIRYTSYVLQVIQKLEKLLEIGQQALCNV